MQDEALIADIGGTHSRLALGGAGIHRLRIYDNAGFDGLEAVISAYLDELDVPPAVAALAVACPVQGDAGTMTNLGWSFSAAALRRRFGFGTVYVLNDFAAIAHAVPALEPGDVRQIGGGAGIPGRPAGILGPGTGLGVSGLVPHGDGWIPVAGEGGHVTLAPANDEESRIIERLRRDIGHVSAERLLSGPGLVLLYRLLAGADTVPDAAAITRLAATGKDATAVRVVDLFLAMLGTVAGNLALTLGAEGGIYLAGGILPKIADRLALSGFRERFVDKGRYRDYLAAIPTRLITLEHPALHGLRALLERA